MDTKSGNMVALVTIVLSMIGTITVPLVLGGNGIRSDMGDMKANISHIATEVDNNKEGYDNLVESVDGIGNRLGIIDRRLIRLEITSGTKPDSILDGGIR